jgi:membrane associated rhomboid family serine protease
MDFQITPAVKNLIIINVIVYFLSFFFRMQMDYDVISDFASYPVSSPLFSYYQYFTYQFLHDPVRLTHIIFNMLALFFFGPTLEKSLGTLHFVFFYLLCGVGSEIFNQLIDFYKITQLSDSMSDIVQHQRILYTPIIGASGSISGVIAGYCLLYPSTFIYIWGIIKIQARYFLVLTIVEETFLGTLQASNVAHFAHIGGTITAIILLFIRRKV